LYADAVKSRQSKVYKVLYKELLIASQQYKDL